MATTYEQVLALLSELVQAQIRRTTLARLVEMGRSFPANPALPENLAAQHDRYLYRRGAL